MPIRLKDEMPVIDALKDENIFVMAEKRASTQDIRELKIAIINIMPDKERTELQLLRLLSNSPLQTKVTFLRLDSHNYKHVQEDYLQKYYRPFSQRQDRYYDGMIITGAPVENIPFDQVDYWDELREILDWSAAHVTSTMFICWASQAAFFHFHGIDKHPLKEKLSGVYEHKLLVHNEDLTRGFDDVFYAPHSRYTGVSADEIRKDPNLRILAESDEAGAYLVTDVRGKHVFVNGHPEYSPDTLSREYFRDVGKGLNPKVPKNYFPNDDPNQIPQSKWRGHANLLFSNWLNYCVYQTTPYQFPEE